MDINQIKCYFPDENNKLQPQNKEKVAVDDNDIIEEIRHILMTFRIDIKNCGDAENSIEICAENCRIQYPKWFKDEKGQGACIEGNTITQFIQIKVIKNGYLTINFKGTFNVDKGKHIPFYIDYKSIKVDGREILPTTIVTWHDKPCNYEFPVKDGQVFTLEIEQQCHRYTEDELLSMLYKFGDGKTSFRDIKCFYQNMCILNENDRQVYSNVTNNVNKYYIDKTLNINYYNNAIIEPPDFRGWKERPICYGGILDENKNYIISGTHPTFMEKGYNIEDTDILQEDVYYFGLFVKQWGHFILECISRLWPFVQNPEKYKNIKIAYLPMQNYEIDGNFLQFLNLLGISNNQLIKISNPTKVKKIIVPDMCSFNPRYTYTKQYKQIIDTVVKNALKADVKIELHNKIYLSHANWKKSDDRDIGEEYVEKFFNVNGYKSISPENFSLIEQINLLYNATNIASSIGTLSHNILFASEKSQIFLINKINESSPFQNMVDCVTNKAPTYIDAYLTFLPSSGGAGPFLYDLSENLKKFAEDNHYIFPENFDRVENIRRYICSYMDKYEKGMFSQKDFYRISKNISEYNYERIRDIISTLLSIMKNK